MRVLLRRGAAIGDVFLLTPCIESMSAKGSNITIDVQTECPGALVGNPNIANIYRYCDATLTYDQVVNLDLCYEKQPKQHIVKSYADAIGIPTPSSTRGKIYFADKDRLDFLDCNKKWVGIDYGRTWPSREWPEENYRTAIVRLRGAGYSVVSFGKDGRADLGEDLRLVDKLTIHQTAWNMAMCKAVLCHDGLLAHVAQAVRVPTVVLYGCTKPEYRQVMDDQSVVALKSSIECQGCHHDLSAPRCHTECARADNFCMSDISVDSVIAGIYGVINNEK